MLEAIFNFKTARFMSKIQKNIADCVTKETER